MFHVMIQNLIDFDISQKQKQKNWFWHFCKPKFKMYAAREDDDYEGNQSSYIY